MRDLSLDEVRGLPAIASGYSTDRVFRLAVLPDRSEMTWSLREERLTTPYVKEYDTGDVDDWIDSYTEGLELGSFRFMAAFVGDRCLSLLTWREMSWNNTVWLVDIRTAEDARRDGGGSALVRRLQIAARIAGVRGISVETQINNYPAIAFYRKHGFEVAGFHDHFYSNRDLSEQDVALFLFWESGE